MRSLEILLRSISWTTAVPHDRLGTLSLRWIYVHLTEETARNTGQLDILRERLDSATGFDG